MEKKRETEKEKLERKVEEIDREIVHFLLTVGLSALTAIIIVRLATGR